MSHGIAALNSELVAQTIRVWGWIDHDVPATSHESQALRKPRRNSRDKPASPSSFQIYDVHEDRRNTFMDQAGLPTGNLHLCMYVSAVE
jgi:hypothetical protein